MAVSAGGGRRTPVWTGRRRGVDRRSTARACPARAGLL